MKEKLQADEFMLFAMGSMLMDSADLIFFKDMSLRYIDASIAFAKLVGCKDREALVGKSDYDFFDHDLALRYTEDDSTVITSGVPIINYIEPLPDKNGKKSYSSTSKYPIRKPDGTIIGLYGIGKDVTAQIELKEEQEHREMARKLFEDVLDADVTSNKMLRVEHSRWAKALGVTYDMSFQDTVKLYAKRFIHKDYAEEFCSYYDINKLLKDYAHGVEDFSHTTYQSLDGKNYRWMEVSSKLYYSGISQTLRLTTFLRDMDDEIKSQEILKRKAETDALTGLLNRESTMKSVEKCLSKQHCDQGHVLLFIDLDNFKQINDTIGHPFGDKVLKEIAVKIRSCYRYDDIVGRMGGDEFLVLLKNISTPDEARKRAQRLLSEVPFHFSHGDIDIDVTCSIGAAMFAPGLTLDILYAQADEAMYKAKKSGKNTLVFY